MPSTTIRVIEGIFHFYLLFVILTFVEAPQTVPIFLENQLFRVVAANIASIIAWPGIFFIAFNPIVVRRVIPIAQLALQFVYVIVSLTAIMFLPEHFALAQVHFFLVVSSKRFDHRNAVIWLNRIPKDFQFFIGTRYLVLKSIEKKIFFMACLLSLGTLSYSPSIL